MNPFALTPEAAVNFWESKVKLSPKEFYALSREAKTRAFAVSGIAKGAELDTVYTALQKSLKNGTPFSDFQKECATIFEARGWTGKRAWRIDNIFRTNIQTAYNVGRYEELERIKDNRPFWRYSAVNDRRTRPAHRAMHGKIFPAGHKFWDTWYPPNGFRCRCSVDSVSQDEMEAYGWKVEERDPTGTLFEPTDPVTGVKLPARLAMPDPGWDFHPGKSALGELTPTSGVFSDLPGLKGPVDYRRTALKDIRPQQIPPLPATPLVAKQSDEFYIKAFVDRYGKSTILTDPLGEPVLLSLRNFLVMKEVDAKEVWKFEKGGHGESIPLLRDMVEKPFEIWLTPQSREDGLIRLTKRYVSLWMSDDNERIGGISVFEVDAGIFSGVTAFLPLKKGESDLAYLEKQRRGILLWSMK